MRSGEFMDTAGRTPQGTTILDRLVSTNFTANADRTKFRYDRNIWLAPYGSIGIPRPQDLHVARACQLSCNSISFFFPLAFTRDLLAIRIGDEHHQIDVCGKIISQTLVETREFGPTNLIECRFIGKLFLG